ncbi:MAG: sulfite exporter TauE/SafE family protein [Bacteroidota bacterium]|nr:sulfite exporter TauE/SafE family protein [Bacteroidota bacterium]MDP4191543.1 sulfite exporter TauE/SafE family protein [Bacteroidota bacterium]MDP4196071.1 sulfite exporter TauE/SafE family protein [Bacteroidota bacterium]
MTEIMIFIILGLAAGVLSGLVGVGGGILIVPALVFICGMTQHQAQGTSLAVLIPPVGLLAAMTYYKQGFLDLRIAGLICIGFVVGALYGAKLAISIPEDMLKKVFGIFLLLAAVKMIFGK